MSGWRALRKVMSARSKARVLTGKTKTSAYIKRVAVAQIAARLIK